MKFSLVTLWSKKTTAKVYSLVIVCCILVCGLQYIHLQHASLDKNHYESLQNQMDKLCLGKHHTVILLQHDYAARLPDYPFPVIKISKFQSREKFSAIILEVIDFMKTSNCIPKVVVLNSDSTIAKSKSRSSILDGMSSTFNPRDNLLLNNRLKNITMNNIFNCIYNAEQSVNCETLQPLITCQHSSAIVQYLYHSHRHVVNGQPSITIGFEKFESESILESDFIIMKSGLSESRFLVTYRSPFYVNDSKLQFNTSFHQANISIVSLSHICQNPSFRSNIIETVEYRPPNVYTPSKFYKLDDEKLDCNLNHRFKDINIDVEPIRNVLLIMEFRYKKGYSTIKKFMEILYHPFFIHIIYCGPPKIGEKNIFAGSTYVNATPNNGITSYECLTKAVRCGYQVEGYILLSDDAILQPWSFERHNLSSLYLQESIVPKMEFTKYSIWRPWNHLGYGAVMIIKAINQLRTDQDEEIMRFLAQYEDNLKEMAFQSFSDFVYLPSLYASTYMKIGEVLRKYGVFLEIATPYIFHGLTKIENIKHVTDGKYFQVASHLGMKQSYVRYLKYDNVIFHPLKLTKIKEKDSVYYSLFCKYLQNFQLFLLNLHKNI